MPGYSAEPTRPDKAKAIAGVALVYALFIGAALLTPSDSPLSMRESDRTILIDIKEISQSQPPQPEESGKAELEEGAAGKRAEPTPVVAPKPAIAVPARSPIAASPIAGKGSAATTGAAETGTGPGAGESGTGRGGGGSGGDGDGGGFGSAARLLGGNSARLPSYLLHVFAADHGHGHLFLTVSEIGRVTDCRVTQTTGDSNVDQALCNLMIRRSRWRPARDSQGNPITVQVRYTATWRKN